MGLARSAVVMSGLFPALLQKRQAAMGLVATSILKRGILKAMFT